MGIFRNIKENNVIKSIISFGLATLLSAILTFVVGVITRNILGPEQYGYWLTVSILFTLAPLFQLGALNAMNREVPFYMARNDDYKVKEIRDLTLSFIFTLPSLLIIILIVLSIFLFFTNINYEYKIGLLLASFCSFLIYLSSYVEMYYKSQQNFKMASKAVTIKIVSQSLLTLFFVYFLGYEGLYIGMILGLIIQIITERRTFRKFKFIYDVAKYKSLIKIGFPILMVGIIWSLLTASDRLIIAIFMSPKDLGNYGVGMLVFSSMMLLPQVVSQVLYPKIVELVSKEKYLEIKKIFWRVNGALAIFIGLMVIAGFFIFPLFIKYVMPEYEGGIKAGQILILGIYPFTMVSVAANYFNSTNNQKIYIGILIAVIIINFILSILFLFIKYDITSVATATSVSYVIYFLLMNGKFLKIIKEYK
ncbi:polysaccharide biosynthesis protein [Parageobacillus genomosp. 1]|uniref:Polysaccharide biosynthesis protein n=1 Tax=Parageobacillus genomosp. 1 TaxID=1295642 RepID=A0ABC9VB10_9BACL|nr:oligosaccharide flippase family protein [Parageobacillus genomosp. 1]EZP75263.1 polysaccharide biosynthesis protein [Parageobacillus genomosp. 1]